ncbi:MAG TPA: tRNA 2-thiouridine(34) synthase MnmA [Solirubrobacterales bacterium]|nr:tRNA 2-thiouridine(34) synthase MnmA [Solirubrobacterales bacterium]
MDRELLDAYLHDRSRLGPAEDGAFTGAAGGAACGDLSRISLVLEDGSVVRASFDAEGCGATRAATAAVAEMVEGSPVLEVARIGIDEVDEALGGLTPAKRHAAQLAADALHRALAQAASSAQILAAGSGSTQTLATGPGESPWEETGSDKVRVASQDRERVLVAMSGGVDSAVAALLERERGAEVVGVTLKLWADPQTDGAKACCSPEAVLGARSLAHSLGIPHLTLDLEAEFRRRVVAEFVSGYAQGSTPNPCIACNGEVRIAAMVDLAGRLGASYLVTGHYARIVEDAEGPLLAAASDANKDQSYMLAALPPGLLRRVRFPLVELTKPEVREIAARHDLAVAKKPESQDLCFLSGQGKGDFLRRHGGLREREGDVVDRAGKAIGRHLGHHNFTVGQRRGIGGGADEPMYVLATDAAANTVTVGPRRELMARTVRLSNAVLHREGDAVDAVRLRYRSQPVPAAVAATNTGRYAELQIDLGEDFAGVSPGQTAVLLRGEAIVGHGTIAAAT